MTEQEMDQLGKKIRRWGPHEVERGLRRLRAQLDARPGPAPSRWRMAAVACLGAAALGAFALRSTIRRSPAPIVAEPIAPDARTTLKLGDGSEVWFEHGSEVIVTEQTPTRVRIAVNTGSARFRVHHDQTRLFRVAAGGVEVSDLGTEFEVRRLGEGALVSVSEGSVGIAFQDKHTGQPVALTLAAGQTGTFPSDPPPASEHDPAAASGNATIPRTTAAHRPAARAVAPETWRALARDSEYHRAYSALARTGARDVRDDPTDLMLAADVARLSGHPAEALEPLRGVIDRHARDARAPAAAFTLGWVLMNDLARPAEAAEAFASAERLAPNGNLAEDASARAAESWRRSGNSAKAAAQVHRYLERYPHGRYRVTLMKLVGGP